MENEEEYYRVEIPQKKHFYEEPFIAWRNWWKILLILAGIVLFTLLLPFLPGKRRRNYPTTEEAYTNQLMISAIVVSFLLLVFIWSFFVRPKFQRKVEPDLYFLAGQFVIINKKILSGKYILQLQPGTGHVIEADKELFSAVNIGDKIFIEGRLKGISENGLKSELREYASPAGISQTIS